MKLVEFHDEEQLEIIGDQAKSMHKDHEVQMARSELYKAAKAAMALHDMLKHLPEDANIEGWVQAKITKASDYLCSVRSYLEYEQHSTGDITVDETMGLAESVVMENLNIDQLAAVSDEALDNAYHYGRSTPGNSFGWQANLKSAEFAKKAIDSGITDIEQIADQIHKGWNVTAQAFVHDPNQFNDTAKLRDSGKLQAKLEQRAKLMKIEYAQLPEEEKEKDRVVARALLNAITGKHGVDEASMTKKFGRAIKGWGGAEDSPRKLVRRNRAHPDQSVLDLLQLVSSPTKGSPQALQKRVLDRKKIPILQKKFRSNENNNYHAENAVLLAKYFGTPEDLSAAQAALNYRDEHDGYDYGDNQARRHMDAQQQIYKKYYPMLFGAKKGVAEGHRGELEYIGQHQGPDALALATKTRDKMAKLHGKPFVVVGPSEYEKDKNTHTVMTAADAQRYGHKPIVDQGVAEGEYDDTELYDGCFVRDEMDGDGGEVFRMIGDPYDRRVRIEDKQGRGWYISPSRLKLVPSHDEAVHRYFPGKAKGWDDEELSEMSAGATGSASVATSMAGNGFKNGGPGTIKRESAKRHMKGKK
jgi:hypothetical protein